MNCGEVTEERPDNEQEEQRGGPEAANGDVVVTLLDNLVVQELVEGPQDMEESNAVSSVKDAVKAVRTDVHLQETKKPCMTPAA